MNSLQTNNQIQVPPYDQTPVGGRSQVRSLIELTFAEYEQLQQIVKSEKESEKRMVNRAQVLLMLHNHATMKEVARIINTSNPTVQKVKERYLRGGIADALKDKQRSGRPIIFNEEKKTAVVELALSKAPDGSRRWTLRTLAKAAEEMQLVPSISHQQIKNILKERGITTMK